MKTNCARVTGRLAGRVIAALRDVIHLQHAAKGPIESLPLVWGVNQLRELSIFVIKSNDVPRGAGRGSRRTGAEGIALDLIPGVNCLRRGLIRRAVRAAVPGRDAPSTKPVAIPSQDRLNDRHNIVDVLEAIEEVQGLAVVASWRGGHCPLRIDFLIVDNVMDACIFNPGMADEGRLRLPISNGPQIPD